MSGKPSKAWNSSKHNPTIVMCITIIWGFTRTSSRPVEVKAAVFKIYPLNGNIHKWNILNACTYHEENLPIPVYKLVAEVRWITEVLDSTSQMGFGESSALWGIGAVVAEVVAAYSGNKCGQRVCGQWGWTTVFDDFLIALLHLASCWSVIVTRLLTRTGYPAFLCSKDVWVILLASVSIVIPLRDNELLDYF